MSAEATAHTAFRMPSLGADMESGVLLEWLVRPGDIVRKGDIVAVVDTSKAAVEVECFTDGVVDSLLIEPGTRVPVGEVLAIIESASTPSADPSQAAGPSRNAPVRPTASPPVRRLAEQLHVDIATIAGTGTDGRITHEDVQRQARTQAAAPSGPPAVRTAPSVPGGRVLASPFARRLAQERGISLQTIRGTGPDGAISMVDVRHALEAKPVRPEGEPAGPISTDAMRATLAALMARSKREIPHYYLTEQVDLGPAMEWLHECNRSLPVSERLVPAAMLLKAAAAAAVAVPDLNGFWEDGHFTPGAGVHLGVAISLRGGGLVAPAIRDADTLDLPRLMASLRDLVTRTRAGRLRGSEMSSPTITVSNLGDHGVESILGVIYPPQVALVGFGRPTDRPWAVQNMIGIRPIVTVSLAADHRATDGATGARYLQSVASLLQRPEEL
jgi:pyruvate dehydrogenase E2 component (dihydrolipoamide acetyltransferase)